MLRRFVVAIALLLVASTAMAQHKWSDRPNKFEITPFIGYGGGTQFQSILLEDETYDAGSSGMWGLAVDFKMGHRAQLEFIWSHLSSEVKTVEDREGSSRLDLNIDFVHVGWGNWWNYKRVQTFMVTSGGLTSYSPDKGDFDTTNYPSVAFGGGTKIPLTQLLGIRIEGKGYATFVSGDDGAFCNQTDGCLMTFDSSVVWTVQGLVGLVFAFD